MCRICGRMVKCIFDTMPSRVHHVPSRRAFTTIRRLALSQPIPQQLLARPASTASTPSLVRAFSNISLRTPSTSTPTSALLLGSRRPQPPLRSSWTQQTSTPSLSSPLTMRTFSTTTALLGYRRRMDTYSPSRRVQKRRHGYLARLKTKGGQAILKRRKLKGRKDLSW